MSDSETEAKTGCCGSACGCKEATIDVGGKKYCSDACAKGHSASCPCGHSGCKPK